MRAEREAELANEFFRMWEAKSTTMAAKPRTQRTSVYVDPDHLAVERVKLFRGRPLYFCLSGDLPEAGDFACADIDGLPVVVLRGEDERLRAMVNMCSHRGARIYTEDRGHVSGRGVSCPFHAWTYDIYGRLLGQPLAREGFDECDRDALGMRHLEVFERHGIVYVTPTGVEDSTEPYPDPDGIFGDADADIADLHLEGLPADPGGDPHARPELEARDRHVPRVVPRLRAPPGLARGPPVVSARCLRGAGRLRPGHRRPQVHLRGAGQGSLGSAVQPARDTAVHRLPERDRVPPDRSHRDLAGLPGRPPRSGDRPDQRLLLRRRRRRSHRALPPPQPRGAPGG